MFIVLLQFFVVWLPLFVVLLSNVRISVILL